MKLLELGLRGLVALILVLFGIFSPSKAKYGKRLMFLTTVYAAMVKEGILQEISLDAFNQTFCLTEDCAVLEATSVAKGSWKNVNLTSELSACLLSAEQLQLQADRLSLISMFSPRVVKKAPSWMRYDEKEMIDDVCLILLTNGFNKNQMAIAPTYQAA